MLNLEIDGKPVQVSDGSTVMDAATQLGIYVPHFCYHRKLSIAANCRMCLVEVEKAPKPLPACATPVTEGMKVKTQSNAAVTAQKGVMEFLLINHPLDCPICDQGGECQLQDLAVGYGKSSSRYDEPKRVVFNKDLGPLISTDMTRCIHCTRCVRFGQEIAGVMELGMAGRGEHSEIMAFVGKTVNSELSGNMIDLCPVGALTSKPFRYSARTWELSRRKSISPHDSLGSNLIVQVKNNRVMRVVPYENEAINECWLSDRDRFSYEGLNAPDRLTKPMLKRNGAWAEVDWAEALEFVGTRLQEILKQQGPDAVAGIASPQSTLEELYLFQKFIRGLGSGHVDSRWWQTDFSADKQLSGIPWLGMPIAEVSNLESVLLIGSTLRQDQPLLAQRLRQAAKKGAAIAVLHALDDDLLMRVNASAIVAPSAFITILAKTYQAAATTLHQPVPPEIQALLTPTASPQSAQPAQIEAENTMSQQLAASLLRGERKAIFLGNFAILYPQYAQLHWLAGQLATLTGATLGILANAANSLGSYLAGAIPHPLPNVPTTSALHLAPSSAHSSSSAAFWQNQRHAYFLMHLEPELDTIDPQRALAALRQAGLVVALTPYQGRAVELDYADVLLPVAPFTETGGTFVNMEGRAQSFHGVVPPLGETRPAWKVWRVLGNLMSLAGFAYEDVQAVRSEILPTTNTLPDGRLPTEYLSNALTGYPSHQPTAANRAGLEHLAELRLYQSDMIVRRATALQKTHTAKNTSAEMREEDIRRLGLSTDTTRSIRIQQGQNRLTMALQPNNKLAAGVIRLPLAQANTSLAISSDPIQVEQV